MTNNILTKVQSCDCCGCGACYNKCPVGAISMLENEEGFLTPIIDKEKCTNCGLCLKVCPSLTATFTNTPQPDCYAATADDEIRMKSSSGGIFTLVAEHILDKGGYVCGAAFKEDWNVHHIIVDNKEDLAKLRGSKYVQSNTEKCYSEIKKLLDENKYILFSGCPCQVAGLKTYLGKEYEKLYTIDLVCHGVPSPAVLQKYLNEYDRENIAKVSFRDKEKFGWATTMNIFLKEGSNIHKWPKDDSYFYAFLNNISLRESCYTCNYAKLPRQGDITLADFWGIEKFNPEINDKKGISMILLNNPKGEYLFQNMQLHQKHKVPLEIPFASPNYPIKHPSPKNKSRSMFFELIKKHSVTDTMNYILGEKYDVAILNFARYTNYGGILTAYSLHQTIKKLGYQVKTIDFVCDVISEARKKSNNTYLGRPLIANSFKKYFDFTEECHNYQDLKRLNEKTNTFIVGSDQVWRHGAEHLWRWDVLPFVRHRGIYFLSFADNMKKLISYAASFGVSNWEGNKTITTLTKHHLKRFDWISVREESGIDICKKTFNVDAIQTLEPVFLLEKTDWDYLISNSKIEIPEKPYIAYYFLDSTPEKLKLLENVKQDLNMDAIDLDLSLTRPIEDFIKYISNAEFIVTDSFHGCCFSTIFEKNFIGIQNSHRGATRFLSMFPKLGLMNRIISNTSEYSDKKDALLSPIDFSLAKSVLIKEKEFSINWLKNAIESEKIKTYTEEEEYISTYFDELENELAGKLINNAPTNTVSHETEKKLNLLLTKELIYRKYYRYKVLSKILIGKKRKHYKQKAEIYHEKVRKIRKLQNEALNV